MLTGFEPFGGDTINPSKELAKALDGQTIGRWAIRGIVLPVTYGIAAEQVLEVLGQDVGQEAEENAGFYDVVLSLGQAKGRAKVCLERVAINIRDASLPDHAGHIAQDEPIVPGAPAAYFSNLPLRAMMSAIEAAGVPVTISNTAGTYVCNDLLYLLLHYIATLPARSPGTGHSAAPLRVGFIHLPALPEQVTEDAGGSLEGEGPTVRAGKTPTIPSPTGKMPTLTSTIGKTPTLTSASGNTPILTSATETTPAVAAGAEEPPGSSGDGKVPTLSLSHMLKAVTAAIEAL